MKCRWTQLRLSTLDTTHVFHLIDSMKNYISIAANRQYTRFSLTTTLQSEADVLKNWIKKRLIWLDNHITGNCLNTGISEKDLFTTSLQMCPNPTSGQLKLNFFLYSEKKMKLEVKDIYGRILLRENERVYLAGNNALVVELGNLSNGIYFVSISGNNLQFTGKIILRK